MIHNCLRETISVVRIGKLPTGEVGQVLHLANQLQRRCYFDYLDRDLPLPAKYKLPNQTYDLCGAVKQSLLHNSKFRDLPRPLLVLSSEALGDPDYPKEPDYCYFSSREDDYDEDVTIVSLQPLKYLSKERTLQDYLLMMLSTFVLCQYGNLSYHDDSRGCLFDYCDNLSDMNLAFKVGALCDECEKQLENGTRRGLIDIEIIAASMRLLNRALHRNHCFVAMPFEERFDATYATINQCLTANGWTVKKADDVLFPRLITSRILREILVSDLVIADLTTANANVFYEVGLTHVLGNDLLLVTQDATIPFDLKTEQAIFYDASQLDRLGTNILKFTKLAHRNAQRKIRSDNY